jgi:uroporphyrinogen decarboxylase
MTPRERVLAATDGRPTDRIPVGLWRHFYDAEAAPETHVASILWLQRTFGWDFLKVQPRASFMAEDWGAVWEYPSGRRVGGRAGDDPSRLAASNLPAYEPGVASTRRPRSVSTPIRSPEDWQALRPLDVRRGALGEHLAALQLIAEAVGTDVPIIQTLFNPLSIARYVAGENTELVRQTMRERPAALHQALEVITATFEAYAPACLDAGASGVFFATTVWASYDLLTDAEWDEFARPYDRRVLAAVERAPFNVLHVCASHNMFRQLLDYPAPVLNWDAYGAGNPSFAEARALTTKALLGGLGQKTTLAQGDPAAVEREVRSTIEATGGRKVLIGPGCSVDPAAPVENLRAARRSVEAGSRA